jgi:hypothetical protein
MRDAFTTENSMANYEDIEEDEANGFVCCDVRCKAKDKPETLEEYKAAYEHWRRHQYLRGCSHAR